MNEPKTQMREIINDLSPVILSHMSAPADAMMAGLAMVMVSYARSRGISLEQVLMGVTVSYRLVDWKGSN